MKKLLLSALVAAAALSAQAEVTLKTYSKVTTDFTDVPESFTANGINPMHYSSNGQVYIAGQFLGSFTAKGLTWTSDTDTPNAYIVSVDANAQPSWGVAMTGSATITSMTSDEDDNLYVAGQFADEVTFGSTDGNNIVKTGRTVNGSAIADQVSGFIAKYDRTGVLKTVLTFIPERDPAMDAALDADENLFDLSEAADIYFEINQVVASGKRLYVSAVYTGITACGELTLKGSYGAVWGMILYAEANGSVFSLSMEEMDQPQAETSVEVVNSDYMDFVNSVESGTLAVVDGKVVAAWSGVGSMKIGDQQLDCGAETAGYMVACGDNVYSWTKPYTESTSGPRMAMVGIVQNEGLLQVLSNYTVSAEGDAKAGDGINLTALNPADLTLAYAKDYDFNEGATLGDGKPDYCVANGVSVANGALLLTTCKYDFNRSLVAPVTFWLQEGALTAADEAMTGTATFVAPWGVSVYYATQTNTSVTYNFGMTQGTATGIEGIGQDIEAADAPVEYYNLQGVRVANPSQGIYIRRQGAKVDKVLVK